MQLDLGLIGDLSSTVYIHDCYAVNALIQPYLHPPRRARRTVASLAVQLQRDHLTAEQARREVPCHDH